MLCKIFFSMEDNVMMKRQRKIATRSIVAGLLIAITSGCAHELAMNSADRLLIVGTIDVEQETETEVEITGMKSEAEKFQEQYEKELAILSKETGLPVSDVSPYCDRGYVRTKTGESLNIREKPDISSESIVKLDPGTIVRVVKKEDDFYRVVFQDQEKGEWQVGYAFEEFVEISNKDILEYELISVAIVTASSSENRDYNMALACQKLDGTVLEPKEEYEWYGSKGVGNASKENGFKDAPIKVNGHLVTGDGGGVCQVTTTLYNAVLKINLEILEHHNHYGGVSYVPKGMDATVSYGSKNFVFKNTKNYPIYIEAYSEGGQVVVCLYRIK